MTRAPPRLTRTGTLFPVTMLVRSVEDLVSWCGLEMQRRSQRSFLLFDDIWMTRKRPTHPRKQLLMRLFKASALHDRIAKLTYITNDGQLHAFFVLPHTSSKHSFQHGLSVVLASARRSLQDRKSTRLNSSH